MITNYTTNYSNNSNNNNENNNNNNNNILILIISFCRELLKIDPFQRLIQQNKLSVGSHTNLYFSFDTGSLGLLQVQQMGGRTL